MVGFDKLISGLDADNGLVGQIGVEFDKRRLRRVTRGGRAAPRKQVRPDLAWAESQAAARPRLLGVRIVALTAAAEPSWLSAATAATALDYALRAAGRGDFAAAERDKAAGGTRRGRPGRSAESTLVVARGDLNKVLGLPPVTVLRIAAPPLRRRAAVPRFSLRSHPPDDSTCRHCVPGTKQPKPIPTPRCCHTVTLSPIARISVAAGQRQITREDLAPFIPVTGRLENRDLDSAVKAVQARVAALRLPPSIRVEYGGPYAQQQPSFTDLAAVFAAALLLAGLLLTFLFERWAFT